MPQADFAAVLIGEAVEGTAFSAEDLARACGVAIDWVHARAEEGVLHGERDAGAWRFDSLTLVRARRIVQLETTFDADPQLAALTADLIEELARLRRQMKALGIEPD